MSYIPPSQVRPFVQQGAALSFATTGVKITYTVPAGRRAMNVRANVCRLATVGTPSIKSAHTPAGGVKSFTSPAIGVVADNNYWLPQSGGAGGQTEVLGMTMGPGDTFTIEVTALVAGTTADILIYGEEVPG